MSNREARNAAIEALIDTYGLAAVLEACGEVASEKADHIRSNYGDKVTAAAWDRAAVRCEAQIARVEYLLGRPD